MAHYSPARPQTNIERAVVGYNPGIISTASTQLLTTLAFPAKYALGPSDRQNRVTAAVRAFFHHEMWGDGYPMPNGLAYDYYITVHQDRKAHWVADSQDALDAVRKLCRLPRHPHS